MDLFDGLRFKKILKTMTSPNLEVKVPTLSENDMIQHAATELRLLDGTFHKELKPMVEEEKGNAFVQSMHDRGAIKPIKSKH